MNTLFFCMITGIAGARTLVPYPTEHRLTLVEVDQLGVDPWPGGRVGLIIVVHELARPAEQSPLGVAIPPPDLLRQQPRLAVGGKPAGQRHAVADPDRRARL